MYVDEIIFFCLFVGIGCKIPFAAVGKSRRQELSGNQFWARISPRASLMEDCNSIIRSREAMKEMSPADRTKETSGLSKLAEVPVRLLKSTSVVSQ